MKILLMSLLFLSLQACSQEQKEAIHSQSELAQEVNHEKNNSVFNASLNTKPIKTKRAVALNFTNQLRSKGKLSPFISNNWTFIYQSTNRCTGSTYGEITYTSNTSIDSKINIEVENNSESAWACTKKETYSSLIVFDLKEKLKQSWDRFEVQPSDDSNENNVFYILGGGESESIEIRINDNNLITTLKYISDDPG